MSGMPLISVIVPVFEVEQYLNRCIQTIVNQTYSNLEIILVDDGSGDNCPAICDTWAGKDDRIRVIHKENGGLSDARNAGMSLATGEYIGFVDSDDWISPRMYELLMKSIHDTGSDIAACSVEMVWEDETPNRLLTVKKNVLLDREKAQEALLKETLLKQPVWYKLYKRRIVDDILFERGKYHEDVFWSYQAVGRARTVSLIADTGYYYAQRPGSIMGEGYSLKRLDALEAIQKRYQYMRQEFPALEQEALLSILSNCIYHGQMTEKYLSGADRKKALHAITEVKSRYRIRRKDYKNKQFKQKIWFDLARVSLPLTCLIRNLLQIGF